MLFTGVKLADFKSRVHWLLAWLLAFLSSTIILFIFLFIGWSCGVGLFLFIEQILFLQPFSVSIVLNNSSDNNNNAPLVAHVSRDLTCASLSYTCVP